MQANRRVSLVLTVLLMSGCNSKPTSTTAPVPGNGTRAYSGTASVGDFLSIAIDPSAHMLSFFNRSNGDSASIPYTVGGDGSYTFDDPSGNLISAYEVPDFVLLIEAAKTGPGHDTQSLVMAVSRSPISVATIANTRFNLMQFRTSSGGLEVGSALIDAAGVVTNSSYWPYGAMSGGTAFNNGQVSANAFIPDSSGTFMRLPDGVGGNDYMFGTPNGVFAVDTQNGAILGFRQAAAKDFDGARAGTYRAIFYHKTGATTGVGNIESGIASLEHGVATVTAGGVITITGTGGNALASGTLLPVADAAYLYGSVGQLADPAWGLFTARLTTVGSQQDVFVTFLGSAVMFSSYATSLPESSGNLYEYFYGAGLR